MKYWKFFVGCLLIIVFTSFKHPFYLSVTEIEYSSKTKELGMSIKFFPDDLEETLRKFNGNKYDVIKGDKKTINPVFDQYIKKHLSIKLNGINKPYQFLGYEINQESVWIYFSILNQPNIKTIEVTSNIMYEYKSEQTNIIHLKIDEKRESFKLNYPDTKAVLKK